jgi:DNA (cytosine-5)-methyltransferase 1
MVLDAANFGVPQYRRRVFFVGYRGAKTPQFPIPTNSSPRVRFGESGRNCEFDFLHAVRKGNRITNQKEYESLLPEMQQDLPRALTVRDAISDLPNEVFKPKETNVAVAPYSTEPQNSYQSAMRRDSGTVLNHASKQHLLRRQARVLLLEQGDYGNHIHTQTHRFQKVAGMVSSMKGSSDVGQIMRRARTVDVEAEQAFLEQVEQLATEGAGEVAKHIASGGFANKYRRLEWDKPSHTLVAHMARDCSDFIHPSENRPISVREAARLQSFPDRFVFKSSQFRQFRGIGNSVPPYLAGALANQIRQDLGV